MLNWKRKTAGALLLASLLASGCQANPGAASSASSAGNASSSKDTASSSAASSSAQISSSKTSSSSSDSGTTVTTEPFVFSGLVKIYFRNASASYDTKRIYAWGLGSGNEYEFDNQSAPDDYGVYKVFDMAVAPWSDVKLTSINFIIKIAGTWGGQSSDTKVNFADYKDHLSKDENGRDLMTVYSLDTGNKDILCYASKIDATGDYVQGASLASDWKSISVIGGGSTAGRTASEVGLCASYALYGFTRDYYLLSAEEKSAKASEYLLQSGSPNAANFTISLETKATPSTHYEVQASFADNPTGKKIKGVSMVGIYDTADFITNWTYDGNDLGLSWADEDHPTFKLWAPTASHVELNVYRFGTPEELYDGSNGYLHSSHDVHNMSYGEHGVWYFTNHKFGSGIHFYTYSVTTGDGVYETIDPYAQSSGLNGIRSAYLRPSEWTSITPSGFAESLAKLPKIERMNQLSVYETHIRDFTADKSWISSKGNRRGSYAAFSEEGTVYNGYSTGFDSLKELGVNAVQLLPVFDQDNDERIVGTTTSDGGGSYTRYPDYNWGYNPLNYNVVEGSYSSDPESATAKISEFMGLVKNCADNGIRVIMDVVYNHLSNASNNAFNKTMPKYFFKTADDGSYIDETGCNNTFNSARKMGAKYIVDSVSFWAKTYGIKGFRFDLMGALERSTMRQVKDALYAIDPSIVVYGEGWKGSGYTSDSQAGTEQVYRYLTDEGKGAVGCFNDAGRDGLKGNTIYDNVTPGYGFMSQGQSDLSDNTMYNAACTYLGENRNVTQNGYGTSPTQTVNYASCHDNYTLYDQLKYAQNAGVGAQNESPDAMEASLATSAFILMSQGLAFIQGGEEIFRSKMIAKDDPLYPAMVASYQHKNEGEHSWIEGDGFEIPDSDGTYLVRNSYKYGDAVNAYKWDRKATYHDQFLRYKTAVQQRNALLKEGYLGVDYSLIQGSYSQNGTSYKYTRLWDDMISVSSSGHRAILAAQTEFSKNASTSSLKDFYIFLGGRMTNASDTIGIGNGTFEVLYDSTGANAVGSSLTRSDNLLPISKYQCLVVRRA